MCSAELGVDTPEDLLNQMIDGDASEVAWPTVVKPVHRKKIRGARGAGAVAPSSWPTRDARQEPQRNRTREREETSYPRP